MKPGDRMHLFLAGRVHNVTVMKAHGDGRVEVRGDDGYTITCHAVSLRAGWLMIGNQPPAAT
jgi:hypothetical protein